MLIYQLIDSCTDIEEGYLKHVSWCQGYSNHGFRLVSVCTHVSSTWTLIRYFLLRKEEEVQKETAWCTFLIHLVATYMETSLWLSFLWFFYRIPSCYTSKTNNKGTCSSKSIHVPSTLKQTNIYLVASNSGVYFSPPHIDKLLPNVV